MTIVCHLNQLQRGDALRCNNKTDDEHDGRRGVGCPASEAIETRRARRQRLGTPCSDEPNCDEHQREANAERRYHHDAERVGLLVEAREEHSKCRRARDEPAAEPEPSNVGIGYRTFGKLPFEVFRMGGSVSVLVRPIVGM